MGRLSYNYHIPLHIVNLNCTGNEESIWNCPFSTQGYCTVYNDVSVACHGKAKAIIDFIYIVSIYRLYCGVF